MGDIEAAHLVSYLKGLFPKLTKEQGEFLHDRFVHFAVKPVQIAIDRMAEMRGEFVDRPLLLSLIDAEIQRMDPLAARRDIHRENTKLKAEVAAVDAFIAEHSDAELAELKSEVIAAIESPWTADRLKDSDPRSSAMLKGMIYAKARGAVFA